MSFIVIHVCISLLIFLSEYLTKQHNKRMLLYVEQCVELLITKGILSHEDFVVKKLYLAKQGLFKLDIWGYMDNLHRLVDAHNARTESHV